MLNQFSSFSFILFFSKELGNAVGHLLLEFRLGYALCDAAMLKGLFEEPVLGELGVLFRPFLD